MLKGHLIPAISTNRVGDCCTILPDAQPPVATPRNPPVAHSQPICTPQQPTLTGLLLWWVRRFTDDSRQDEYCEIKLLWS